MSSWIILGSSLLFLVYLAYAVKNEFRHFLEDSSRISLGPLAIFIPRWWKIEEKTAWEVSFRQKNVRDWKCFFGRKKKDISCLDFPHLVFDEAPINSLPLSFFSSPDINKLVKQAFRREGTCTELEEMERRYVDSFFIELTTGETFYFYTECSVLSGMRDGPYFEEAMKNLTATKVTNLLDKKVDNLFI